MTTGHLAETPSSGGASLRAGRREWVGLAVLTLPTVLIALDTTVLHLAVPHLSADLAPSASQLLWILDIYGFLVAGFLVTMGTLGDRIGRRLLLLIGALFFGLASIVAAFSTSAEMLIATRALLGIAGATLMPSTLSLIRNMFRLSSERTIAISVWITSFTVGAAIGPLVGGLMLEFFWWGSVFLLGVPVMALLLAAGPFLLPEYRDPASGRLDVLSVLLSITAVLLVIYGLKEIAKAGPGAEPLLATLAGLALGWIFVRRQRRLADPVIDVTLFRRPSFGASIAALVLGIFALSGAFLAIYQYLQGVLGLSPFVAGLWMLPCSLAQVAVSVLVPKMAHRYRPVWPVSIGLVVAAFGLALMALTGGPWALAILVIGSTVMGAGFMPLGVLGTDLVIGAAPPAKAGAASALSETGAEFGMALGIAAIGSVAAAIYRAGMREAMPTGLSPADAADASGTIGGAMAVAARLEADHGAALMEAARAAFTDALQVSCAIGAVVMLATAVLTARLLRGSPAGHEQMEA